jgi:hypothetical protein
VSANPYERFVRVVAVLALLGMPLFADAAVAAEPTGLQMYGFVQGDFIYDVNRVDPAWNATLRASKIPVVCPGDAGCGTDGETIFSMRQTQFGVKGAIPTEVGAVNAMIEFDLFGTGDQAGTTTPHLRHAWAEFGSWGVGQTWTLLKDSDAAPVSLNYWGPIGMMSALPPQVRWTRSLSDGSRFAIALEAAGSSLDQGNVTTVFPDLNVTTKVGFPDATAQYRREGAWGHWQAGGIVRRIEYETRTNPNGQPAGHVYGYGANLAGALKGRSGDALLGQIAYGRGIASYFNDCCVDIGPDENLRAEAVPLFGWLLYYDHRWAPQWRTLLGYSEGVQRNTINQTASAMERGRYASANLLYAPAEKMLVGGELLWGERRNKDGARGHDTRLQFSTKYAF